MASAQSSAATLRQEVMSFRMVELQSVAERLGLRKTGRKGELQSRILQFFGELDSASSAVLGRSFSTRGPQQQWKIEQAARVVHDTYRRMMNLPPMPHGSDQSDHTALMPPVNGSSHYFGASAAAMAAAADAYAAALFPQQHAAPPPPQQQLLVQAGVPGSLARPAGMPQAGARPLRVRCICNVQSERGNMAMCQGRGCGVWQHCDCLGLPAAPASFLCELCRARLADPFWEVTEQVLPPSRLKPTPGRPPVLTSNGPQEVQSADRVFYLNQQQLEPAQRDPANHRVQAGCVFIGDEVPLRYHWPKHVELRINSMPHRPYGRAHNAKMGINQRDDVASIGAMVVRGRNSLSLSTADSGTWVIMLQLARRRTLDQVKSLMLTPETLEAAAARVRRHFASGGDDSEDDLLVAQEVVSLKDPMSGQRMQVPARFVDASGLQPFDLDSFLSMAQRNRKWQDPTTLNNSSVEQLQVDTYMQRVLECLKSAPNVSDVEISAEGQWRPVDCKCDWFEVTAEPQAVAAALAAARAPSTAGGNGSQAAAAIKAEPGTSTREGGGAPSTAGAGTANGTASGTANGTANGTAEELVLDSDASEEEDEMEELRKAAAAVRRASAVSQEGLAGQKRKEPEVIDLLSSDEDEAPQPPRTSSQQSAQPPQSSGAAASQPPCSQPAPLTASQQTQQALQQRTKQLQLQQHIHQQMQQKQQMLQQQQQQQVGGGPLRIRLPARRPVPQGAPAQAGTAGASSPLAALSPAGSGGFQPASQLMPQFSGVGLQGTGFPPSSVPVVQRPPLAAGMRPLMAGLPPGALPISGLTSSLPPGIIPVGLPAFPGMLPPGHLAVAASPAAGAAAAQHVLPVVGAWPGASAPVASGLAAGSRAALPSQASSCQQQPSVAVAPGPTSQAAQLATQESSQQTGQQAAQLATQQSSQQTGQQAAQPSTQQSAQQAGQQAGQQLAPVRDPRMEQEAAELMRELAEEQMLAQLFDDD